MNPYFTKRFSVFFSAFLFLLTGFMVSAWTGPTGTAPTNNVSAPINVGTTNQVKSANLGVNGLAVFGNSILQASSYLNWGATAGSTGYGIWDNAGTLNFKNSGGQWQSLQAIVSGLVGTGGTWTTNGSSIYYNSGNVGIGTASPSGKLESDSNGAGVWAGMFNYGAGAPSGAYGIWSHGTSYALYTDGPIVSTGNVTVGSAVLATNGDLYMPWNGQWLSTYLSTLNSRHFVTTTASCSFGSGNSYNCTATCPGGYSVTGGGASRAVINSIPSGNGWWCQSSSGIGTGSCYAVCGAIL